MKPDELQKAQQVFRGVQSGAISAVRVAVQKARNSLRLLDKLPADVRALILPDADRIAFERQLLALEETCLQKPPPVAVRKSR